MDLPAIEILEIKFPVVKFRGMRSKEPYIRSLCADIGENQAAAAIHAEPVRTRVGEFRLADAPDICTVAGTSGTRRGWRKHCFPQTVFSDFPMLHVEEKWRKLIDNGNAFYPDRLWNRPHIRQESGCASTERG